MAGAAWVIALLAAGCSKEGSPAVGWASDPQAVRIDASVGAVTKTNPLGTDEEQTKFSGGDKIAVAALDNGAVKKTVKYQFDGSSWAPVADETGATDYFLWDTPVTFRAWYPAGKSADGSEFKLPGVQVGSKDYTLADADFMTSDDCTYSTLNDIPGDRTFKPVLTRRMALVTIVIDKVADEYADLKDIRAQVKTINSAHSLVKLQSDGTFKPEGEMTVVRPYSHKVEEKSAYSAIVVPGEASKEVFVNVDVDGYKDDGTETIIINEVTGIPAAEAGKHYTYKLIVGKETVKIAGVTVVDWTTGLTLDGNFEAEVENYSEWDGKITDTDFSGDGTQGAPFLITSVGQFRHLVS